MIIIIFLWMLSSLALISQFTPICINLSNEKKVIVGIIIIIGGPIIIASNLLILILDQILPEGWDEFDDFNGY